MNCPDSCPQLVKCWNSQGTYFQCSAKTVIIGYKNHKWFKTPIRGAIKLKMQDGKPAKREDCK